MAPVLRIERLGYVYANGPVPIFRGLNLSVEPSEFIAIVGQSGVGKSTLLRCVANLVAPSEGRVTLAVKPDRASRACAFVFQDTRLMPWRRVQSNVAYGLNGLQLKRPEEWETRSREALGLALVDDLAQRWPYQLSGGQAQRVGIARALAVRPKLLLMDEPFSAVDAMTRQKLQDELLNIWHRAAPAILFVTHDIEEAVYLADRVIVLSGSPAHVSVDHRVSLPRPRDRNASALQETARLIADAL
ncbi:MAG: ABC transporter ATP-binding protein [Rhodanobacteraceae bacterium]|nr:MAG: ABC transporter ATP-binding protein [Rhodanobacteraceae bacterium]